MFADKVKNIILFTFSILYNHAAEIYYIKYIALQPKFQKCWECSLSVFFFIIWVKWKLK